MKQSKLITQLIAIVITVFVGVAFAAANNWTPPTGIPPAGNADAPINTSGTAQEKLGGLILGSGLAIGQPALYLPTGNLLLGTAVGSPAPNGQGSNIDVNDIYIRSSGKWASTFAAATPAATCTPTDWSPVVDANNVCSGSVATQVKTNADCTTSAQSINGAKDCSTPVGSSYTPGEWFNNKLVLSYSDNDDHGWGGLPASPSFIAGHAINKMRIRGTSDDGGYCYAYWGTGHAETMRHDGAIGYYNVDGEYHQGVYEFVSFYGGADSSNVSEIIDDTCPTYPPTFDNVGNAKICQINWSAGAMADFDGPVNIPAGAQVFLQGRHTRGAGGDTVACNVDIQYAP